MKKVWGFSFLALVSFAVFGFSVYGIVRAQEAPTAAYFIYLTIAGIVAGLGGGISFLARALKAAQRRD